ncbi:ATP-binding protein [Kitasatospora sp. NPDC058444]|uniref:ATP-binding protein n=1 Tax=Kitasatospora sp. NPDC058444 TaxID=3346504 RepID=UPI003650C55B
MPGTLEKYSCWLPRHRKSVAIARKLLREFLFDHTPDELLLDASQLVLSELVTNAVVHAKTPPGRLLFIRFERQSDALRIEVHDADATPPTAPSDPASETDEAGRGLFLVSQLSVRWGCCPREGGIGKVMWAQIEGPR